jgi:hypothetical protein
MSKGLSTFSCSHGLALAFSWHENVESAESMIRHGVLNSVGLQYCYRHTVHTDSESAAKHTHTAQRLMTWMHLEAPALRERLRAMRARGQQVHEHLGADANGQSNPKKHHKQVF